MTRNLLLTLLLASTTTGALRAQGSPAPVKYGKWLLLAGAVGMNLAAASAHRDADAYFQQLTDRCTPDHALCDTGSDGSYLDQESERLYEASVAGDRRARNWLIAGEGAALGAAVMFVWEFARPKGRPADVPFEPTVRMQHGRTSIGLKLSY